MSLHGSFLSDEQFQCSICLDLFTNPSSTPCGHSFCMACISSYWDGSQVCQCPLCKKTFQKRPALQINRTLREITEQFKSMRGGQEIQEMIKERNRKIEEIRMSLAELELAVERETAGSVSLFSALVSAVERSQAELMEVLEMSYRAAKLQASTMICQLELEVKELRRRENALEKLSQSNDHIHCVKSFPFLASPAPTKDWSRVSLNSDLGTGSIYRSLAAVVERFQEELKTLSNTGFTASLCEHSTTSQWYKSIQCISECSVLMKLFCFYAGEKRVQEYAVDITLDSNTAHPRLILSEDMKSVRCGDRPQLLPDNSERFDRVICVLGREAISSGRHYWEVEVGGKTDWDLGVARQSANRKGNIKVTPSKGYWFLSLRDKNKYAFPSEPSTDVHLNRQPHKIGVFVDFDKGQVSFYNVDAKIHIYTFNDTFTQHIYPFFSPCTNKSGKNDGPLVITPVFTLSFSFVKMTPC
uniref:nuclear factor 7, brain n=1 Tax=Monopterus albus TaxID=43700 RepID=UPI0009B3E520|nr:nuclear factor 7, brain-like [Monopterus albus]